MLESKKTLAAISAAFCGAGILGLYVTPRSNGTNIIPFLVCIYVGAFLFWGLGVILPFLNVITRVMANYAPKTLRLEEGEQEGEEVFALSEPAPTTYFTMRKRILQIEGAQGLIKACVPFIIKLVMLIVVYFTTHVYRAPATVYGAIAQIVVNTIVEVLISLPFEVIVARCIVTPYQLPWFHPTFSLRCLLSKAELRKPWILYSIPGFASSLLLLSGVEVIAQRIYTGLNFYIAARARQPSHVADTGGIALNILLIFVVFAVKWASGMPLKTVATRLAVQNIQKNAAIELDSEDMRDEVEARRYSDDDDVVQLREELYTGLVDCIKGIVREEGWRALYRGWMLCLVEGLRLTFAVIVFILHWYGVV
ncbi:hypothetical protein NEOLEDRAFT_1137322 [Neolentinus lepideus HHB14362 ss-1]|uniref:Mitochondrial carrier n=1 Tax=Neolentinus lepideus HHB14362 ss-1 TaxID=1314782 RepID=A0A165QW39_9AGAM|nr:hypothetical protein NEOLEDRAFT_1137322 [Neolentinus lepideus HHB14362 ss-1]